MRGDGGPGDVNLKRVVVVYDYGSINGGAAQVAIASALGLQRAGLEVDYFCAVGPAAPSFEGSGVRFHCLEQPDLVSDPQRLAAATRGLWNRAAAQGLRKLLEICDPRSTVVHVHGWTKGLSTSIFRVIEDMHIPSVTTLHEFYTACPNGGFFDYQRNEICTRRAMGADCITTHCDVRSYPQKLWRVARQGVTLLAGRVPSGLRDVIYISDLSREILTPYFSSATRWHAVRNPLQVEMTPRARAEENAKFLFVGRLSPEKGADLFAAAAAAAGVGARIVGDGPVRERIAANWPGAELTGWLQPSAVLGEIRASRALVFPSFWYEGQPLVVQEALANGVPVIVADRTAAREVVRDGRNGAWFRHGDEASLIEALRRMTDDTAVEAMSRRAHADYWASPPTPQAHIDGLVEVYAELLGHYAHVGA